MRPTLRVLLFLVVTSCQSTPAIAADDAPAIHIRHGAGGASSFDLMVGSVDDVTNEAWSERFRLYVSTGGERTGQPPVLGSYRRIEGGVRFTPRFPLQPGLRYRAEYQALDRAAIVKDFQMPDRPPTTATEVAAVYPSASTLPENQLKFYLHFTAPMARGEAYDHLRLLDEANRDLDLPFLEIGEELWDQSGKRLTLLLDPARVKRGLKPREEQGPVLSAGRHYTLVVDRRWRDASGRPLGGEFRKGFGVGPPDEKSPDPRRWRLNRPTVGSREPLVVRFGEPLDQALLERMLWVVDASGQLIPGEMQAADNETSWSFVPEQPWKAGKHQLKADPLLEDLAGNSIARKFEVEPTRPRPNKEAEPASVEFTLATVTE